MATIRIDRLGGVLHSTSSQSAAAKGDSQTALRPTGYDSRRANQDLLAALELHLQRTGQHKLYRVQHPVNRDKPVRFPIVFMAGCGNHQRADVAVPDKSELPMRVVYCDGKQHGERVRERFCEEPELTMQQRTILKLRAEGMCLKEIASVIGRSVKTAEFHWANIMGRLGLRDVALITQYALATGIAEWKVKLDFRRGVT